MSSSSTRRLAVLVASLGYLVDLYDLKLFHMVRVESLLALGIAIDEQMPVALWLMNAQLLGMLFGGIASGVMGDRWGRLRVLYGSILLYSVANVANAFVGSVASYTACRFVAGVGLAGELGAAVAWISELVPPRQRTYATTLIGAAGALGALAAGAVVTLSTWKVAYLVGGGMGLGLLVIRWRLPESPLFLKQQPAGAPRGSLLQLVSAPHRRQWLVWLMLAGLPVWVFSGLFNTAVLEVARAMRVTEPIVPAHAMVCYSLGVLASDLAVGALSQRWRSRRKATFAALAVMAVVLVAFPLGMSASRQTFYVLYAGCGMAAGHWLVVLTAAAELFGTNLRNTVTSSLANGVRAMTVPMSVLLTWLQSSLGLLAALEVIAVAALLGAVWGTYRLPESFAQDLDFTDR